MPRVGVLNQYDPNVGVGLFESSCCGVVQFFVEADQNEQILDIKYKVKGCPVVMAASAYLAEICLGSTCLQAIQIQGTQIAQALDLSFKYARKTNIPLKALLQAIAVCQAKIRRKYSNAQ